MIHHRDAGALPDFSEQLIVERRPIGTSLGFKSDPYKKERALHDAGEKVDAGKIRSLVADGARIQAVTYDRHRNVLHKIFSHSKPGDPPDKVQNALEGVEFVLQNGGDIKPFDLMGKTPLMLARDHDWLDNSKMVALIRKHEPHMEQLLQRMDLEAKNARDTAAWIRHDRTTQLLLDVKLQ